MLRLTNITIQLIDVNPCPFFIVIIGLAVSLEELYLVLQCLLLGFLFTFRNTRKKINRMPLIYTPIALMENWTILNNHKPCKVF